MLNNSKTAANNQSGFSLLEMVIAIFILTFGLIGTVAAIAFTLQMTNASRNIGSAKLVIISTFEEIEALRNDHSLNFKQIANVGQVDNTDAKIQFSGFSTDFKPVSLNPGPDYVNGTDDDLRDAGADQQYGTADDFDNQSFIRSGYLRKISISTLENQPNVKKIEVKVRYFSVGGSVQEIVGICYINDDYRSVKR